MSLRALRVATGATLALSIGLIAPLAVPTASATPAGAGQSLGITPANARDIGGYDGAAGSTVRTGLIFRSNDLSTANVADLAKITATGITDIIDFRSPAEVAAKPDPVVVGATNTKRPIYDPANDFYALIGGILAGGAPSIQAKLGNGGAEKIMEDYYRWIITTSGPSARNQLAATFKEAATSKTPIMYHCTSGKDRTGIMTAILLTALGTPKNEVYDDYLKSNTNLAATNAATIAGLMAGYHLDSATAHLMDPILGVESSYLDAVFDQIQKSFGSFDNFLRNGLGVDTSTVAALKKKMLVFNNATGSIGMSGTVFGS